MNLKLIEPTITYEQQLLNYKMVFQHHQEKIHGGSFLEQYESIAQWIEFCNAVKNKNNIYDNLVPAYQFLLVDEEKDQLLGMINCRLSLNEYLFNYGGHIGYSIHPAYRRRGLASYQLQEVLKCYRQLNFDKILITCDKDNIGSRKVIEYVHGQLENELIEKDKIVQRFWVNL